MGTTNNRISKSTQMPNLKEKQQEQYDEFIEYNQCCGIPVKKTIKRTIKWEENLIEDCEQIKSQAKWAQDILDLVKSTKLPRTQFLNEVNELKKVKKESPKEEQILLTPSEIDTFKTNLKKSVLLSFGQASQTGKMRENQKLQSTMMMGPKKQKKKNEEYIDRFRRSTIAGDRSLRRSVYGYRDSIMSFVDDTISSLFRSQNKQISKQAADSLEMFVNFTVVLEGHFKNPKNIICLIRDCFVNSIIKIYSKIKMTDEVMEILTNNIKQFLAILKGVVFYYYKIYTFLEEQNNIFIGSEENLLTVVTAILFKHEEFYSFFFEMVKEFNRPKELKLRSIMKKISEKPPEYFQVKSQYCLNVRTLKKYMEDQGSFESNIENVHLEQLEVSDDPPYYKCFLALKEIVKTRTPIAKLKIIMECSEKITQSIEDFNIANEIYLKNWVLDADQILSVFCYIIANTKIPFLHSHLFILEHFATDHQLISITGYYYSVLTCAIEQLEKSEDESSEEI